MSNFVLKGRWYGEIYDENRCFKGRVVDGGHTGLKSGDEVTVTYKVDQHTLRHHTTQAGGGYSLDGMPDNSFILTSFLRRGGVTGHEVLPDEDDQEWGGEIVSASPAPQQDAT
ncbi:hypothetical protein GCM10008955_07630 [Deinococcus malanensis]|uniref:Uncharacterized protein n=1 Tax=Deinococcus malanensis TaxID=1706855 RepID=A0ABQ2ER49_9DEIO|nr:hypothetical protein [Deinococcus malanensis]GGK16676.1 hypothetical protein GCM10008955_07630 [Deinococcus malanensis]